MDDTVHLSPQTALSHSPDTSSYAIGLSRYSARLLQIPYQPFPLTALQSHRSTLRNDLGHIHKFLKNPCACVSASLFQAPRHSASFVSHLPANSLSPLPDANEDLL